ncbi:Crp/Fnr family transcriptional regulator [uncultured Sulfitobacter sp.]|uniref:Crp/Fnr family transcriptional regulator n=1 Tax=uncultured Sulfitobacter sp. TaxID=191468 RepID=UPI00262D23C0|nr:Crp/Fnr family transcriptional regulator [uncultured Sulfitobacter sp.]
MRDLGPINAGFLADASPALKDAVSRLAQETTLDTGTVLFRHGDPGDSLHAILSGSFEFSVISSGGRKLTLDVMHKGAIFGEIAFFDPGPRTATVIALEPSNLWTVSGSDFLGAMRDEPELGIEMLRLAGKRMRWMGHQLSEQVFQPLATRLAGKVLYLAAHDKDDAPLLALSKTELAEFAGASREAVSKILSGWARCGYVESTRGGLRLLDRQALEELSKFVET